MGNTKEEILLVSLHLFAQDGYEAVSVSQIAGELGITKGALYRHYQSKRDIFDHILACMEQGDGEQTESHDMPQERKEDAPETYQELSFVDFMAYSQSMFAYWTEDDFASSFRKMLTLEQFRNAEMQELYQQYLVSGPVAYVKDLCKVGIIQIFFHDRHCLIDRHTDQIDFLMHGSGFAHTDTAASGVLRLIFFRLWLFDQLQIPNIYFCAQQSGLYKKIAFIVRQCADRSRRI